MTRPAFTLTELLVSLLLFTVVASVALGVVRQQQRYHHDAAEIVATKRSLHDAVELPAADLRALAPTDIQTRSDSALTFRRAMGVTAVCALDSARTTVIVPSRTGVHRLGLAAFLSTPVPGDSVLLFDPGPNPAFDDDEWWGAVLVAAPSSGVCPLRPAGLTAHASEMSGLSLSLGSSVPERIAIGAPVRVVRTATFSRYRASNGEWMLGFAECPGGACGVRQPISGPYQSAARGGIVFQYFSRDGAPAAAGERVARIELVARARSRAVLRSPERAQRHFEDSIVASFALRGSS